MDTKTGKLYKNYDDAVLEMAQKLNKEQIDERLMPLSTQEFDELKGMNRAERRIWAKEKARQEKKIE